MACEGSSTLYGRLLLGTRPNMDAVLTVPCACTAHSTLLASSTSVEMSEELNAIAICGRGGTSGPYILCEQCTHVEKGRG